MSDHRVQSAAEPPPSSLLRMGVAGMALAVPIDAVREILEMTRLTPLPRTPDILRGVMNLRGAVVPVIDLAVRLGKPAATIGRRSCIVVAESRSVAGDDPSTGGETTVLGLLVDAVYEVFDVDNGGMEPVPALGTKVCASVLAGMARARGEAVPVLAMPMVLALGELERLLTGNELH